MLDVITTFMGLKIGLVEGNPLLLNIGWGWLLFLKTLVILVGILILEKIKLLWFDIFILVIVIPPVIWNVIQISLLIIKLNS
jgi:hypothetical protein